MQKKIQVIPIMHCFDNNYVIPASVAFYSLIDKADKNYFYKLYVLHSDITKENQKKLINIVKPFSNASLEFIDMSHKFNDLFDRIKNKSHYSKEVFYKLMAPQIFPQYDHMLEPRRWRLQ